MHVSGRHTSSPPTHNIRPIGQAIRETQRDLSEAEWVDDAVSATRARAILSALKLAKERGEEYAIPFCWLITVCVANDLLTTGG